MSKGAETLTRLADSDDIVYSDSRETRNAIDELEKLGLAAGTLATIVPVTIGMLRKLPQS